MWFATLGLLACSASAPSGTAPIGVPKPVAATTLPALEQLVGGVQPGEPAAWVVTLHGRGSDPERFQRFFADMPGPARIFHLEAPVKEHDGRAWFTFRGKFSGDLQREIQSLAAKANRTVADLEKRYPTVGKPSVVGFSQGSMVVYDMVLQAPEMYAQALPVSGAMLTPMPEDMPHEVPPVVALHGMKDPIIGPSASQRAINSFAKYGLDASLRTFPDAVHWIDGELKTALHQALLNPPTPAQPSPQQPSVSD